MMEGERSCAQGYPDHTIANPNLINHIHDWEVIDTENNSDHHYIHYKIDFKPLLSNRSRFNTDKGNHTKFKQLLRTHKIDQTNKINKIENTQELNEFTKGLVALIRNTAKKVYRYKKVKPAATYSYWTPELKIMRNKLMALRRKFKSTIEERQTELRRTYHKHLAEYKLALGTAKRKAWQDFCHNQTNPFDPAQKFMTGKFFKPDEIKIERPNGHASKKETLDYLTKELFGPSAYTLPANHTFTTLADVPFTQAELHTALYSLNVKKAPGPDCIDFRLLRLAFEALPRIFTRWANLCLAKTYFPLCLRQGEVVYFLKQGKSPSEPSSYRPICLLPTLGKFLEKILVIRLTHHLESNKILHPNQFGFRENHSCDKALDKIITHCKAEMQAGKYTSLVSLDIQGAFDNVEWRVIATQLVSTKCPSNIAGTISSYLSDRSVLVNWGGGYSTHPLQKGCPQGSCLGPILWLLIANKILNDLTDDGHSVFAFADDFTVILSGRRRLDVEEEAQLVLPRFCQLLDKFNLHLSTSKTKALTFGKPHNLKRPPVIRINNISVNHVKHLRLLGVTLDKNLTFIEHIHSLKLKLTGLYHNTCKMTGKTWGLSTNLLKIWYSTIIEKIITYGAGVWAGNLSPLAQTKLSSIQRLFLLQMSRGYRTVSTDALNVVTGIPPIRYTLQHDSARSKLLQLKDADLAATCFPNKHIQHMVPSWILHPAKESSHEQVDIKKNTHTLSGGLKVYTDGSRTESGVGAAFCAIEDGLVVHRLGRRLRDNNTVFQAELYAIQEALTWLVDVNRIMPKAEIFSDSLSALQAIHKHRTKHPVVLNIKHKLLLLKDKVALAHVLAHRGTFGNELADREAKAATTRETVDLDLPVPHSYIKRKLKEQLLQNWQDHWDYSDKGRKTNTLIPKVNQEEYPLTPSTTAFLTGHGPFKAHLNRFNRSSTQDCVCGRQATADHYYYECTLTKQWHIRKPDPIPEGWLHNILTRQRLRINLQKIYEFYTGLTNLTD